MALSDQEKTLQIDLGMEVTKWVDKKRGERSRASFILAQLRQMMYNDAERERANKDERLDQIREELAESK